MVAKDTEGEVGGLEVNTKNVNKIPGRPGEA